MRKKVIDIVLIASMTLGFINSSHAQKQGEKTLLQQLGKLCTSQPKLSSCVK
jgi:hypothetical protein